MIIRIARRLEYEMGFQLRHHGILVVTSISVTVTVRVTPVPRPAAAVAAGGPSTQCQ